jgi:hypothetical protein
MNKFDYVSNTSEKVIEYLTDRRFELTDDDLSFIRITINEATNQSWEEGTRDNGCNCGQVSCPICTP